MPLRVTFAEPMSTGQVPSTGGCALEMDGHSMGDRELEEFEEYLLSFDVLPTHEPLADIEAYLNSLNDHRAVTPQKTASASEVSQASPTSVMEEITGWEETIDAENGLTKAALLAPEPSSTPSPEPKADVSKSTTPDFAVLLEFAVQAAAAATTIQRWWKKPGEELEDTPERCYLLWVRQLVDRRLNAWQLQHTTKENEARYFCRESIRMQRDMFSKKTNWYSEKELQEHIIECFNDDWPVTSSLANCRDPLEYYDHVPGSALYKVTREFLEILDDFSKELETKEAVIEAECNAIYEPIIPYEQWLGRYKVISAVQDAPALDMSVKVSPIFRPLNRSLTVRKWSALIFLCEDYPNFKDPHPKSRFVFLDSVAKHHHEKAVSNQVVYKRESACNIEAAVTAGKQIKHTSEAPRQSGAINQLYPNHGCTYECYQGTRLLPPSQYVTSRPLEGWGFLGREPSVRELDLALLEVHVAGERGSSRRHSNGLVAPLQGPHYLVSVGTPQAQEKLFPLETRGAAVCPPSGRRSSLPDVHRRPSLIDPRRTRHVR